jgi:small conductance mechanosensitive channel
VDGLENFGEHNMLIRALTKVKPGKHLHIQHILRKMLKNTFDREEFEIPIRLDG